MTDIYVPAPSGSTDTAAPQVTTPNAEQQTPQVEKPAGEPQAQMPAGEKDEQAASDQHKEGQSQEEQPKTWKEKRQERNRQRWQEYKEAKTVLPQRLSYLEQEVARLRGSNPPDFNQIADPTEALAKRAAWEMRASQAADAEQRLKTERENAQRETDARLAAAWQEAAEDARARIPDFDQVVTHPAVPITERMLPFLAESEKGTDIAYWLALPQNREAARDLAHKFETAPAQALIEFGRIEARLSAPAPKPVSTAPRPAPALNGGVSPMAFDVHTASVDDVAAQLRKAGLIR